MGFLTPMLMVQQVTTDVSQNDESMGRPLSFIANFWGQHHHEEIIKCCSRIFSF
jgi:hypothetical protein